MKYDLTGVVPKFFKDLAHYQEWQKHCIHTDGMNDAIGEKPCQSPSTDADLTKSYEQGYQDGQAYLAEEAAQAAAPIGVPFNHLNTWRLLNQ